MGTPGATLLFFGGLVFLLAASMLAGVAVGLTTIAFPDVVGALWDGIRGTAHDPIVWELRLPRVVLGALVGMALGSSGAAYQGIFRNPLADPYLMGAASGAVFGTTLALTFTQQLTDGGLDPGLGGISHLVAVLAFVGALSAVGLTILLAGGVGRTHDLILAGVVLSAVLTGLTTYLMLRDTDRILQVLSYTFGSLAFASWPRTRLVAFYLLLGMPLLCMLYRPLNALQLGEAVARTLGLPLDALKLVLIGAATLITAAGVSQVGVIGFVGLIVPHIMRRLVGGGYGALLPASALGGGILLVLADLVARTWSRPIELPVGVVTTLLGGPFFLYLLRRSHARA